MSQNDGLTSIMFMNIHYCSINVGLFECSSLRSGQSFRVSFQMKMMAAILFFMLSFKASAVELPKGTHEVCAYVYDYTQGKKGGKPFT